MYWLKNETSIVVPEAIGDVDHQFDLQKELLANLDSSESNLRRLFGNHEIMNILGIFDYVSPMGIKHFEKGIVGREKYFMIGSDFCKYLACGWNPIVKIGDCLFCHGGINYELASKYSIDNINYIMINIFS